MRPPSPEGSDFAYQLMLFRKKRGYTQKDLAKKLGVSTVSIFKYEKNPDGMSLRILRRYISLGFRPKWGGYVPGAAGVDHVSEGEEPYGGGDGSVRHLTSRVDSLTVDMIEVKKQLAELHELMEDLHGKINKLLDRRTKRE